MSENLTPNETEESVAINPNQTSELNVDHNYTHLIAAQLESERRMKIRGINRTLSEERIKKNVMIVAGAACFIGGLYAFRFSGIVDLERVALVEPLNAIFNPKQFADEISKVVPMIKENLQIIIQQQVEALNSFTAFKEYLTQFTPGMALGITGAAISWSRALKHRQNYKKKEAELQDMSEFHPTNLLEIVENQARM